ncbi:hypothetical protein ACFORL_11920 [Legionella dresdenensis]|uniref:Uncharacterized protein n=1 Tax=Legionella dresdenensis TaxID=450200 RepID=A0ABV8CHJ0_9GAMM
MSKDNDFLKQWIHDMAGLIESNTEPDSNHFNSFLINPELAFQLIDIINLMTDEQVENERAYYSACIYALDVCVAQLQSSHETGSKSAHKTLNRLMDYLAEIIRQNNHSLSFWLPILNAFYDVHVELSSTLRDAYLDLAGQDVEVSDESEVDHLAAIQDMITELSDLSVFDIAENFFAQSHAMPAEFFCDLVIDLYSVPQGQDIALLGLMHPKPEVRSMVAATIEELIHAVTFTSNSLSRLQVLANWYPQPYQDQFNRWIKIQRMKGVVFRKESKAPTYKIKSSEVDGSGAQGIFVQFRKGRKYRLCGLLLKQGLGIKDAWITPEMDSKEIERYYADAFDESVSLRGVNVDYLQLITNHFLAVTVNQGKSPDLHLLEIQEMLGLHFHPELIDIPAIIDNISIQITPFTPELIASSFKRSRSWFGTKAFCESWFIESAHVDKLVNRCSSIVNGVKICVIEDALDAIFELELEKHRDYWLFHFLWAALWLKSHSRKNEKTWQDSFLIAYSIHNGTPLIDIPIMQEIARNTVLNSIETMNERRTYLNQE